MTDAANRFYNSIQYARDLTQGDAINFFVYFLTVEMGEQGATTQKIRECFEACDLPPPARIAAHLSEGVKKKPPVFVKKSGLYRLHRHMKDVLSKELGAETVTVQASAELRRLEAHFPEGPRKVFLKEAIDCFEANANRASIVMSWIVAIDHLYEHIINHNLKAFNSALALNNDKRIKIKCISKRDDFSEIPEGKFIELCRVSKIISNDVRKILDTKLGIRNSAAHPSGIEIKSSKVIEFIEDLVANVIHKYPV